MGAHIDIGLQFMSEVAPLQEYANAGRTRMLDVKLHSTGSRYQGMHKFVVQI